MKLNEFIRPASLSAARDNLRELGPKGMLLAGGTALHFMQDHTPVVAVDIMRLGLSFIKQEGDHYTIGATTSLADIQRYRAPRWALHEICRRISTHQIRNISTLGGNICRVFPWADLPVILLALNARMVIFSGQEKELDNGKKAVFLIDMKYKNKKEIIISIMDVNKNPADYSPYEDRTVYREVINTFRRPVAYLKALQRGLEAFDQTKTRSIY